MTYRQTKQREEILQVIRGVDNHMTADEVYRAVVKTNPDMGIATVYRNLNRLVEMSMIARIVDKDLCYYDGNNEPHYHVKCVMCKEYHDAPMEYNKKLDRAVELKHGVRVLGHSITFDCICEKCDYQQKKN